MLLKIPSSFRHWKNFENRLRVEKIIAKSLAASFLEQSVFITCAHYARNMLRILFTGADN